MCPTLKLDRSEPWRLGETLATVDASDDAEAKLAAILPLVVDDGADGAAEYAALGQLSARGGLGTIERGRERATGREVAIKRARDPSTPGATAMLLAEGRAMASLRHRSIAPLLAAGRDAQGRAALVIRWVEGVTWAALLHDAAHPAWRDHGGDRREFHLRVLAQVAEAAHYAHGRGWLHRDIKPENVMVGPHGEAWLIDWGLAVAVPVDDAEEPDALVGTPGYMAPEMIRGTGPWLSPRTDVYLLGAVLHEVLTARPRHEGGTLREALYSAWVSAPVEYPADAPAALAALANEATSARPDDRPPSADAFRRRLEAWLGRRAAEGAIAQARARFADLWRPLESGLAAPALAAGLR
jgi:serine/threonine-protein kinase